MTTISHKRRRQGRGLRLILVTTLVLVVVAILVVWRAPLVGLFWFAAEPAFGALANLRISGSEAELRKELVAAQALAADRDILLQENINLKSRLGRVPAGETSMLAAVLLRPPASPYDTLMLDVGLQSGISVGDLVFAGGAVVVGRITEVHRGTSRATLYSAPGEAHDALVYAAGGSVPVIMEGQGGGSFKGQLPQGVEVRRGDPILFSSLMPILAARISAVEVSPGETFQTVYMQLPVNPLSLRFVEVRKPAQP